MARILIVGEAPGARQTGQTKKRLDALAGAPWEEWAEWTNLLDEWPGASGQRGHAWNVRAATTRARELPFADYDLVLLLGRRVASCVLPGGAGLPWFRRVERGGARFLIFPHTSGASAYWNEPENVARAANVLSGIAQCNHGTMSEYPATAGTPTRRRTPMTAAANPEPGLQETLLGRIREAVDGVTSVEKQGYVRLNVAEKTLVYVGKETRSGVRLEVTRDDPGYDKIQVAKPGEINSALSTIKKRATKLAKAQQPAPVETAPAAAAPAKKKNRAKRSSGRSTVAS